MLVGIPKEAEGESRVAIVPEVVPKLARLGLEVLVERGAGGAAGFPDALYAERGARATERDEALRADLVLALGVPAGAAWRRGQTLLCTPDPLAHPARVAALAAAGVTAFALELVPRISRAQSMDVLSSQAGVGGYRAVLLAALHLKKLFPLMMTSAGTVRPARVFVLGAGVAGLQAIATARRLGAVVEAYDIRAETKEQVASLGAKFLEFDLGTGDMQDARGYAKELTDEQKALQARLMAKALQAADVVITTAQVPGRRAPRLVAADVVEGMRPGSVIVDMAADSGGNCELSLAGEVCVRHGVTIVGLSNLPGSVPQTASFLYANNLLAFLQELLEDGQVRLDLDDELVRGTLVCHAGEVTHPRLQELLQ